MLALPVFSSPLVFSDSLLEVLTLLSLLTLAVGAYRKIECHQTGCHRIGRFTHGHLHLCAHHHPLVPDDGRITATHIAAVTNSLSK
jgi:hypothetical protein